MFGLYIGIFQLVYLSEPEETPITTEEKEEEQRNRKEREERLARKHRRPKHKPDPFEIRLKRRLDELFDGHG